MFTFLLIFLSTESALHLYDKLMRIGVNYGIRNVGQLVYRFDGMSNTATNKNHGMDGNPFRRYLISFY